MTIFIYLCLSASIAHIFSNFPATITTTNAFSPSTSFRRQKHTNTATQLYGGIGIAKTYSWKEEQYEIELRIKVPKETTVKDIQYKARSKSIHLVVGNEVLLDGSREMRGLIDLDGTFWSLVDSENGSRDGDKDSNDGGRDIVITIEKMILPPKDPFEVVEFDWNGIYPDDEGEIVEKKYDVPEELDIREYAKSLGVDIDNINMTLVDKNMFSSGLNMTRSTLDELTKAGYVKEVTRQGDGTELIDEGEFGKTVPFNPLGDNIGRDEMEEAGIQMDGGGSGGQSSLLSSGNPYMKKDSSWFQTMPVEEARTEEDEGVEQPQGSTMDPMQQDDTTTSTVMEKKKMSDPIDLLTVSKLKEVLKREGLKTSGTKKELQERLKEHVRSVMKIKNGNDNGSNI